MKHSSKGVNGGRTEDEFSELWYGGLRLVPACFSKEAPLVSSNQHLEFSPICISIRPV